jgi:hypothetical protein
MQPMAQAVGRKWETSKPGMDERIVLIHKAAPFQSDSDDETRESGKDVL